MGVIAVDNLIADVRMRTLDAPAALVRAAYVRAARRLCLKSGWLRVEIPGATVVAQQRYSLGNDTYVEICGIYAMSATYDGKTNPVTEKSSQLWDPDDEDGPPVLYQYVPEGQFALHPLPDAVYPLTVTATVAPKRGATSIAEELAVRWEYELQDGALAFLLAMKDQPWANPGEAQVLEQRFRVAQASAAIAAQRAFNAGSASTADGNATIRTGRTVI